MNIVDQNYLKTTMCLNVKEADKNSPALTGSQHNYLDTHCIATFYKLIAIQDLINIRSKILDFCRDNKILGTIILSEEGINSTVSGTILAIKDQKIFLQEMLNCDITFRTSPCYQMPFHKLKVKIKTEIVKSNDDRYNVSENMQSHYIEPNMWDQFICDTNSLVIDVRNKYEIQSGCFKNAINPETEYFRDFSQWFERWSADNQIPKETNIAIYCTGGIRCEKAAPIMKGMGYNNVYQLHGGILDYFSHTKNRSSLWQGECFVFDDRVLVDSNLNPSHNVKCFRCALVIDREKKRHMTRGNVWCDPCYTELYAYK